MSDKKRARYPSWPIDENERIPNLSPAFVKALEDKLSLRFVHQLSKFAPQSPEGQRDRFRAMDILSYVYAVLHAPSYRERYTAFLRVDFPRIPLPANADVFGKLGVLGRRLLRLHLREADHVVGVEPDFPKYGESRVEKGYPRFTQKEGVGRVWINTKQYWEGIPQEIWEFQVGGYQVCRKWLQSRRGRILTNHEIEQYKKIVATLMETNELMEEIDRIGKCHGVEGDQRGMEEMDEVGEKGDGGVGRYVR